MEPVHNLEFYKKNGPLNLQFYLVGCIVEKTYLWLKKGKQFKNTTYVNSTFKILFFIKDFKHLK